MESRKREESKRSLVRKVDIEGQVENQMGQVEGSKECWLFILQRVLRDRTSGRRWRNSSIHSKGKKL